MIHPFDKPMMITNPRLAQSSGQPAQSLPMRPGSSDMAKVCSSAEVAGSKGLLPYDNSGGAPVFKANKRKTAVQADLVGARRRSQNLRQLTAVEHSVLVNSGKILPHLPDEIGLAVFSELDTQLNPITLMTLMNVEQKDRIPPCLTHAAWENKYWAPFSQSSSAKPHTNHAHAFVERWNAMSARERSILKSLWSGQPLESLKLQHQAGDADISDNFDIVMAAVRQNGKSLEFASPRLQADPDIVRAAVRQNGAALDYASDALWADKDIVMDAVNQNGTALAFASDACRRNRDIVMAAVRQNGEALWNADAAFRGDRAIVVAALSQNGWVLQCAATGFGDDPDIVMIAVKQYGSALRFASAALQDDRDIVEAAVRQDGFALEFASAALQNDRNIVMTAVSRHGAALEFASAALRQDKGIVMAAVRRNPKALQYACAELQKDPQVLMAAGTQSGAVPETGSAVH